MRTAAATVVALSLLIVGSTSAVAKPPPVLDGVKVKKLTIIQEAAPGAATVDPTPEQVANCKAPACARITFVFKPAKAVKDPLTVTERNFWIGLGDVDLYLMQGTTVVASCTGTASNKRYLSVPQSELKPGATYSAVMYYSHEIGETTSMDVELPGAPAPGPVEVDATQPFPEYSTTVCGV